MSGLRVESAANGGEIYRHLRCQKQRRKRYGSYNRRGQLIDRVSIYESPAIVDSRSRIGAWELDTIIGKNHKQAIVSLTERKSRFSLIQKVERKTATCVADAIISLLSPLSDKVITMTSDNGKEFAHHKTIADKLNADFFFAHPYASWERGLNKNTNGLMRQYFPKGSDFTTVTKKEIDQAMGKINNRPRKCLGMRTPNQVLLGINPSVALAS
ncbi:hypothetical protein BOW52_04065 [Solemya elarraichensis gill symbiont]|uniref:Integrase catalytic domain-containing protein n=1 Tax=Solemya elarraichensis gill symbiont TaxID=1918949 RepID=A0A1T2L9W9_9GAMM|nr:IS30 family transposase [Solemya elarraichensis gill symbiont]OOZ41895.1 hypothetical protein BOW52_04065 [Solemya elarraichensis gill symbiont]